MESLLGAMGNYSAAAQGDLGPKAEQQNDDGKKHSLMVWTGLNRGDVVSLRTLANRFHVGTVEERTNDGLIIWIRDELNERKLFHFRDLEYFGPLEKMPPLEETLVINRAPNN
jgi:hypothetical protein